MARPTRWVTDTKEGHSQWYIERFRRMRAEGEDLAGEARFLDAMMPRGARILDAGCGTGRVGAELYVRGHTVVGVDADPELIDAARADHPGPEWKVANLSEITLDGIGQTELFDAALLAGNVMVFVAPGTEEDVLRHVGGCVREGGVVVVGFHVNRNLALADFDRHAQRAGLRIEHRFSTWQLDPWRDDADWATTVLRR